MPIRKYAQEKKTKLRKGKQKRGCTRIVQFLIYFLRIIFVFFLLSYIAILLVCKEHYAIALRARHKCIKEETNNRTETTIHNDNTTDDDKNSPEREKKNLPASQPAALAAAQQAPFV